MIARISREELIAQSKEIVWWHQIPLAPDFVTDGADRTLEKLCYLKLPNDLRGKRVLDIGCSDGFFSFKAEELGADVVAIDAWRTQGFAFASKVLGSRVQFHQMSVYDLTPETFGLFHIVLFLGVYYHLKHPLLALERIAAITKEWVLVESEVLTDRDNGAAEARFYEADEFGDDPTTWWVPNTMCLIQTVRAAGFPWVEVVSQYGSRAVVKGHKTEITQGQVLSEDIIVNIDQPRPGASISGVVNVEGWAIDRRGRDGSGVHDVKVYLDGPAGVGELLGCAAYGDDRPDIVAYLGEGRRHSAFRLTWDTTNVMPGRHVLYVHVQGASGWAHRAVEVVVVR